MKRIAGEGGSFEASKKYLLKQLGIGKKALNKSIKYLIDHGWIEDDGYKKVRTAGGWQEVRCYKIVDLWELNIRYYSKGGLKDTPLGGAERATRGGQKDPQGGAERATTNNIIRITKEQEVLKKNRKAIKKTREYLKGRGVINK